MEKISIILPTLNERENIVPLIRAIRRELANIPHEVLVVDDQSPDGTAQAVMDLKDPAVRVLVRTEDHGYAKSLLHGIENSKGDLLILMDSDFNHDPGCLPYMVKKLAEYDCVSGSRFLKGGSMTPAWRGIFSRAFNRFIRQMTGGKMTDHLFGFFGLRREALARCPSGDIFFGFGDYGMRLLFYLQKDRARIHEFPSLCGERPAGRGNRHFLKTFCRYFKETWALAGKGRLK